MTARHLLLCGLAAGALAACTEMDPYRRPGAWQPEGANAGNIAVMAQQPMDLIRGRDAAGSDRRIAAEAVHRLWNSRAAVLPGHAADAAADRPGGDAGPAPKGQ